MMKVHIYRFFLLAVLFCAAFRISLAEEPVQPADRTQSIITHYQKWSSDVSPRSLIDPEAVNALLAFYRRSEIVTQQEYGQHLIDHYRTWSILSRSR